MNHNRANFLICYSPKFSLCHGILSLISFCTELIVKNASERARPRALPLKIKPLKKYRFSNLVQKDRIIYHSTQNHETNPAVYRSSPYLAVFKNHFRKFDFYSFCVFLEKIGVEVNFFFAFSETRRHGASNGNKIFSK